MEVGSNSKDGLSFGWKELGLGLSLPCWEGCGPIWAGCEDFGNWFLAWAALQVLPAQQECGDGAL